MTLSSKVEVRVAAGGKYGPLCKGLFAKEAFQAGEAVWWEDPDTRPAAARAASDAAEGGTYMTRDELLAVEDAQIRSKLIAYSFMIDDDLFSTTAEPEESPAFYFNHSCDGNCCYETEERVVTMRDVAAGEELTYDYALTETEASLHAGMRCLCDAATCRGVLQFDDYRSPAFTAKYRGKASDFIERKMRELGWHDGRVRVRRLPGGQRGLFALAPIPKGATVLVISGKVVDRRAMTEYLALNGGVGCHCVQVGDGLFQIPGGPEPETPDLFNHSCSPSCGMRDSVTVVAMRDIAEGEQITVDYATITTGDPDMPTEHFECSCGPDCRGRFDNTDWQKPELQEKYRGYFPHHHVRLIEELQERRSRGGAARP